jgi:hypothetical protein
LTRSPARRTFVGVNPPAALPSRETGLRRRLLLGAAAFLAAAALRAEVFLSLAIDAIEGEGWQARGIVIDLVEAAADRFTVAASLQTLELPDGHGTVAELRLECPELARGDGGWRCEEGRLSVGDSPIQAQQATWQGRYAADGELSLEIPQLAVARGTVALELSLADGVWSLRARPQRTALPQLAALSGALELPRGWGIEGRASGLVTLGGEATGLSRFSAELVVDQINYASPDGLQAAENLLLKLDLDGRARAADWQFDASLRWPRGAFYSDPLFLDAAQGALVASARGRWRSASQELQLDSWSLDLAETVDLSGTGRLALAGPAIRDLTVAARSDDLGRLYRRLLQPFLIGTAADDLEAGGRAGLALHLDAQGIEQAGLDLSGVTLADRQGRFSLDRTDGSVAWDRGDTVPVSRLRVQGAGVYRIPTGSFAVDARFAGDRVRLLAPVVVPVLGGELALDRFELDGALVAGSAPRWQATASVRDVSLERLTEALDWPPFGGSVAGQLRDMRYADRLFTIGGGLRLEAFDGEILISDLSIREPLGTVPILEADARLRGISLEALTQTFSFGRIQGRLDGDVADIRLVNWQPEHFDLHFYTPKDDDSRHRISQRAVENLTELGSGVPAGLSTTFLSIFDEFGYDRIDLKIALRGNVAVLDGLERPDGGYYLVKGAGLPRIDVIGRNRSVAWKDLVERLQQIQVEGAQIR